MVIAEEKGSAVHRLRKRVRQEDRAGQLSASEQRGLGLKNIKTTARNGKVVALKAVQNKDDLMMITAKGMIIRTGLDEIRSIGRNTQGVRLIKLKPDDKLVAAEKIGPEEPDEGEGDSSTEEKPES